MCFHNPRPIVFIGAASLHGCIRKFAFHHSFPGKPPVKSFSNPVASPGATRYTFSILAPCSLAPKQLHAQTQLHMMFPLVFPACAKYHI